MYSSNFGVADPDAPRGLKRRMVQPAAVTATAIARGRAYALRPAIDWGRRPKHPPRQHLLPRLCERSLRRASVFYSGMPNSLEMRSGAFHYSVIGRFAMISLAAGYVGCRLLQDEVLASKSSRRDSGVAAFTAHAGSL